MLNSNHLKCIAIICMIIDHLGHFIFNTDYNVYIICRSIGRIAMPLFIFLLVEGFFRTKNLKKYVIRISIVAVITQIIIEVFSFIDKNCFNNVIADINNKNILFSFIFILIILRMLERRIIINKKVDILLRVILIITVISVYFFVKIDYSIYGLLIALTFYILKKFEKNINIYIKSFLQTIFVVTFSILAINNIIGIFTIFSVLCILIYSSEKGNNNKIVMVIFYTIYPLQYFFIFLTKLLIS